MFLTASENVQFSAIKDTHYKRTFILPIYLTAFTTSSAFIYALWKLPSRLSTVKYTLIGLTTGIVASYGIWRYSMINYYDQLNKLFRIVTLQRYETDGNKKYA